MSEINYSKLEKILKVKFTNHKYLEVALTHRSFLNENEKAQKSNERLEFLGDAILQFLSSEHIFKKYPKSPEGELTNLRSRLVNTESLALESSRLGLGDYLLVSRGEKQSASESAHILANTFEAVLGAIYLDKGLTACSRFLQENVFYKADQILKQGDLKDSKSLYQEYAQEKFSTTPIYKVLEDEGPDHNKLFKVGVYLDNKLVAIGEGPSKRKAQQEAAHNALKKAARAVPNDKKLNFSYNLKHGSN